MNSGDQNMDDVAGDKICKSCTGILFLTPLMKSLKVGPVCIGKKSSLKDNDKQADILNEYSDKHKDSTSFYVFIGYSQYTGKVERTSGVASFIKGTVQIVYRKKSVDQKHRNHNEKTDDSFSRVTKGPPDAYTVASSATTVGISTLAGAAAAAADRENISYAYEQSKYFCNMMVKGAQMQLRSMDTFFRKSVDNLPQKFLKSASKLAEASAKNVERVGRIISRGWPRDWW